MQDVPWREAEIGRDHQRDPDTAQHEPGDQARKPLDRRARRNSSQDGHGAARYLPFCSSGAQQHESRADTSDNAPSPDS